MNVNLFDIVSDMGIHGVFTECKDAKVYQYMVGDALVEFIGPENITNILQVERFSHFNVYYYSIVVGILFDNDIMTIDKIHCGDVVIPRAKIWKPYEVFENYSKTTTQIFQTRFSHSGSKWDAIIEYLTQNEESLDYWDLSEMIDPTFKQQLEAELIDRKLVKIQRSNKLFE